MRKTFPLATPNLKPARVIDSIKHEVRKYLKRERRKELPEGTDYWDFDCKAGRDQESAASAHVAELNAAIDTAAQEQWEGIYLEIIVRPGNRTRKPPPSPAQEEAPETDEISE
jgi:hypothetical protein